MRRLLPILPGWPLVGLLLVAACYDARRENPLDPALTPPVALSVAMDDSSGSAVLTWTRAQGQGDFAAYWLLRKIQGFEAVDTLAVLTDPDQTSFTDTTVIQGAAYSYRVSIVNEAGLEVSSLQGEAPVLELPAVQLRQADFDSRSATASLEWTLYAGPRFAAYELTRSTGSTSERVAELGDIAATAWRDSGLAGNTLYTYELRVRTDQGESIPGGTVTGTLHPLVASWPIDIQAGDLSQESVHLYASPGNRIHLLYGEQGAGRLRTFDPEGQQLGEDLAPGLSAGRSLAAAFGPDGTRYLSLVGTSTGTNAAAAFSSPGVVSFGADGQPVLSEPELIADALPAEIGEIGARIILDAGARTASGYFDNVTVTQQERVVLAEGFDDDSGAWNFGPFQDGFLEILGGRLHHGRGQSSWVERVDGDLVVEADVSVLSARVGLIIDWGNSQDQYGLGLWAFGNEAQLMRWQPASTLAAIPYPMIPGVPYRLHLGAAEGRLTASVQSPLLWQGERTAVPPTWTSLAAIDGRIALTIDEQAYVLNADGQATTPPPLDDWVSEIRVWDRGDGQGQAIGVCLPEASQVRLTAPLRGRPGQWTRFLEQQIGPGTGEGNGALFYPLSFDVGPDGRVYVLDAGNGRIAVFDEEGNFITEWGSKGSGEGEFDFGEGAPLLDKGYSLAGSVAVDDDGFIYVADVFNRRIQKFAREGGDAQIVVALREGEGVHPGGKDRVNVLKSGRILKITGKGRA